MNPSNSKDHEIPIPARTTSSLHTGSHLTPIYLNLYDLGGFLNACVDSIGLSYYHCAVQTHSSEYGYMGHPYQFTGLYKTSKHDPRFHLYRLRHSIEIGWTWLNEKEIDHIFNELKSFYLGFDYHTTKKNSIHFAKYLIQQLSNDLQLKHIESIKITHFPPYIDRGRRLCETFQFLQVFDTEKDIAEVNILYFLYMKYEGNIKQICHLLKLDTFDKLKHSIDLLEQGIRQRKLHIFPLFTTFDIRRANDYLYSRNSDSQLNNEQLTLTEIFHQFDTITLRGRTSIDRYLNIQTTNELENEQKLLTDSTHTNPTIFSRTYRSSQPQAISQNQGQTPIISPSGSYSSELVITPDNSPISIETRSNSVRRKEKMSNHPLTKFCSIRNDTFSRQRRLPRDLELTNDLYTMKNRNYTNNALFNCYQSIISIENIDSSV